MGKRTKCQECDQWKFHSTRDGAHLQVRGYHYCEKYGNVPLKVRSLRCEKLSSKPIFI